MKINLKNLLLLPSILTLFISSCNKDVLKNEITKSDFVPKIRTLSSNYSFNWETATKMPVASTSPVVSLPWQSQSGNYIDAGFVTDFKSKEGWELVYNTFNTSVIATTAGQPAGGLYFALYNRYRGTIRFFLFVPPGYFGGSTSIQHGLQVYSNNGTTTKLLNFEGSDIIDPTAKISSFFKMNNQGVATGGGWYAMEYELAYDPAFATTTYPNLGFNWNSWSDNVIQISANGTDVGTITGNITTPGSKPDFVSAVKNGVKAAVEIHSIAAQGGGIWQVLKNTANGGLAGDITGVINGIFGGSATTQAVSLKSNSVITLGGTLTANQPFYTNSFVFPGQTIGNTIGAPVPLISHPLGILNLSGKPTVNVGKSTSQVIVGGIPNTQTAFTFTVNTSILNSLIQQNPSVINSNVTTGATIQNLTSQVVVLDPDNFYNMVPYGKYESFGNSIAYTGQQVTLSYTKEHGSIFINPKVAVRVSFKVVPNNGAPSVLIVKTFLANLVSN